MILVTLGTQDKSFVRLLKAIDELITNKVITDHVIVQAGRTKYKSSNMEIIDLVDALSFEKLINDCDLLITHGGVGSIITGLKHHKKVIAVPRLKKYKEHTNDHQQEIIRALANDNYLIPVYDLKTLADAIKLSVNFNPEPYPENNNQIKKIITAFIDQQ